MVSAALEAFFPTLTAILQEFKFNCRLKKSNKGKVLEVYSGMLISELHGSAEDLLIPMHTNRWSALAGGVI